MNTASFNGTYGSWFCIKVFGATMRPQHEFLDSNIYNFINGLVGIYRTHEAAVIVEIADSIVACVSVSEG